MKYLLLLFIFVSQFTFAQCTEANEQCAPIDEWEFSLAVGVGVITSPLHGGSDIPLVLIPEISYYGEKLFLENNALGYSFYDAETFSLSAIGLLNRENSFFNRWHPNNVFVPLNSTGISESSPVFDESSDINAPQPEVEIELDDVSKRKWAVDAGFQANFFLSKNNHLVLRLLHDVNNIYNGFNGKVEYNHWFNVNAIPQFQWGLTAGVNWLSQQQVDYYYGIGKDDTENPNYFYQGESALNPYIKIRSNYYLNDNWRITFTARSELLAKGISNSPLVKDNMIKTIFLGVVYDY